MGRLDRLGRLDRMGRLGRLDRLGRKDRLGCLRRLGQQVRLDRVDRMGRLDRGDWANSIGSTGLIAPHGLAVSNRSISSNGSYGMIGSTAPKDRLRWMG